MIPTLKVVEIKPAHILTVSGQTLDRSGEQVSDPNSVGARRARFSDWDEEE